MLTEESVRQVLQTVKYPGYSRDIISFGLVKDIQIGNNAVSVRLELSNASPEITRQVKFETEQALKRLPNAMHVFVEIKTPQGPAPAAGGGPNPWANQTRVPGLARIVAVASGKGGVGKSTASVNIACALRHIGTRVGLLDCDIYGPSIPLMMGIHDRPVINEFEKLVPPVSHGIKLMSMGFLVEGDAPVIWRGPMIMKTIHQFFHTVEWGELDMLLVDLPPGTGDAQLSLCQTVPLDGGVIVTTPQEASLGVVRKGIAMFQKVHVPILGILENMSYYTTPNGERVEIFGHGGGKDEAERQGVSFLGEIPLFTAIREGGDRGIPITVSDPNSEPAKAYIKVAETLRGKLG